MNGVDRARSNCNCQTSLVESERKYRKSKNNDWRGKVNGARNEGRRVRTWMVMWREPEMLAPARGWAGPNSLMQDIRPGISTSASSISMRPARENRESKKKVSIGLSEDCSAGFAEWDARDGQSRGNLGCASEGRREEVDGVNGGFIGRERRTDRSDKTE